MTVRQFQLWQVDQCIKNMHSHSHLNKKCKAGANTKKAHTKWAMMRRQPALKKKHFSSYYLNWQKESEFYKIWNLNASMEHKIDIQYTDFILSSNLSTLHRCAKSKPSEVIGVTSLWWQERWLHLFFEVRVNRSGRKVLFNRESLRTW